MLTDAELKEIADKIAYHYTGCSNEHCPECIGLIREAVRLTALRCAAICREHKGYEMEERAADACAAEIEEKIVGGWFDPNSHGRGGI